MFRKWAVGRFLKSHEGTDWVKHMRNHASLDGHSEEGERLVQLLFRTEEIKMEMVLMGDHRHLVSTSIGMGAKYTYCDDSTVECLLVEYVWEWRKGTTYGCMVSKLWVGYKGVLLNYRSTNHVSDMETHEGAPVYPQESEYAFLEEE